MAESISLSGYLLLCSGAMLSFVGLYLIVLSVHNAALLLRVETESHFDGEIESESLTIAKDKQDKNYGAITRYEISDKKILALEEEYLIREYCQIREGALSCGGEASAHTPVANTTSEGMTPKYTSINSPVSVNELYRTNSMGYMSPEDVSLEAGELKSPNSHSISRSSAVLIPQTRALSPEVKKEIRSMKEKTSWRKRYGVSDSGFLSREVLNLLKMRPFRDSATAKTSSSNTGPSKV